MADAPQWYPPGGGCKYRHISHVQHEMPDGRARPLIGPASAWGLHYADAVVATLDTVTNGTKRFAVSQKRPMASAVCPRRFSACFVQPFGGFGKCRFYSIV